MLNAVYIYNLRSKTHIVEVEKFYTENLLKTTAILKISQDAPLIQPRPQGGCHFVGSGTGWGFEPRRTSGPGKGKSKKASL